MDSKQRFSNRVDNYTKYRPSYPKEAIDYLYGELGFREASTIADIGAGTGIFTKLLLDRGSRVLAVEPNPEMRAAAEQSLGGYASFVPVDGSAERTQLDDQSVDFIVSAQAFHWFDLPLSKEEFHRILKPGGKAVLIWNRRTTSGSPFYSEYDDLLRKYGRDYEKVNHMNLQDDDFARFFAESGYARLTFGNQQTFDYEGLRGRVLSASYIPLPGEEGHESLMAELRDYFDRYETEGKIVFHYTTELYVGEV